MQPLLPYGVAIDYDLKFKNEYLKLAVNICCWKELWITTSKPNTWNYQYPGATNVYLREAPQAKK